MHVLFLLNPAAGKQDCTRQLPAQIHAAAARAGLKAQDYDIRITSHAGHARELARAAAEKAQQQYRWVPGITEVSLHWKAKLQMRTDG